MELIKKYFPDLTEEMLDQLGQLPELYKEWNSKINVISRTDIENLEERHILHSLVIALIIDFKPGAKVLDLGTGGGFPGIPLAIIFPETKFRLIDGTGKKIRVVQEICAALGLTNVEATQIRAEELKPAKSFDFVVTRAVATLDKLLPWCQRLLHDKHSHIYPNGIFALKGGNLRAEIKSLPGKGSDYVEVFPISDFFEEEFFEEKSIVYVQG
ncbi:MAG: 16S rRNA (guanine(527)-N(7))-methyltransferase RsmG [Saprospiraceae bacterium]